MMGNALIASLAVPLLGHHPDWLALGQLSLVVVTLLLWRYLPAQGVQYIPPTEINEKSL